MRGFFIRFVLASFVAASGLARAAEPAGLVPEAVQKTAAELRPDAALAMMSVKVALDGSGRNGQYIFWSASTKNEIWVSQGEDGTLTPFVNTQFPSVTGPLPTPYPSLGDALADA